MPVFRISIVLLLVVLVGLILIRNKKDISARTSLAELQISEWPVKVTEVKKSVKAEIIEAYDILRPSKVIKVVPKSPGQIIRIYKKQGDRLNKGETIAKIDDKLLLTQLELSKATLAQARADLERAKTLSEGDAITAQQLEQAQLRVSAEVAKSKSIRENLSNTEVKSPVRGLLSEIYLEEGSMIAQGPICEVIDQSVLELQVNLTENEILNLSVGARVDVKVDAYGRETFSGEISYIDVKANVSLRFPVKIEVKNDRESILRGGMFATVKFINNKKESLWIQRDAVLGNLDNPYVFIADGNSASLREISLGVRRGDFLEVKSGIKTGDQLIVSGQNNLEEGVSIKVLEQ